MRDRDWTQPETLYHLVYGFICGNHPDIRPWHFQWLSLKDLRRELKRILPTLRGRVLDVGCGQTPYRHWLVGASEYVGLDVTPDSRADIVVEPGTVWPFANASFDAILATQVLEHVRDFDNVLREIDRVMKPGGTVVISVPFIYNEHGVPEDFRRFSAYGGSDLIPNAWDVTEVVRLGGAGSTLGVLLLDWIYITMSRRAATRVGMGILMPLWIALSAVVNGVAQLFDRIGDQTVIYVNVLFVGSKPPSGS